jgi:Uma2 family endonuclease
METGPTTPTTFPPPAPERFLLHGVSWQTYVALRDAPENDNVRMTYDRGDLEMMSPSRPHEQSARILDWLIHVWVEELDLDIVSCGTMTCRREDLDRGFEPDNCYYIAHETQMRAKKELDLSADPPPDLAIEIEVRRGGRRKLRLYEAFGVPEAWRYDGKTIQVYQLGSDGKYASQSASRALPDFPLAEAQRVLSQIGTASETALVKSFRHAVRARRGANPQT